MISWLDQVFENDAEAYLETCLTSTMELFEKISNGFKGCLQYIFASLFCKPQGDH